MKTRAILPMSFLALNITVGISQHTDHSLLDMHEEGTSMYLNGDMDSHFQADSYNPDWYLQKLDGIRKIEDYRIIENVFFKPGQTRADTADPAVKNLISVLQNTQGARIMLTGHSDWTCAEKNNNRISFQRVMNLAELLIANQVSPEMLDIKIGGMNQLLTDTVFKSDYASSRALSLNRRVQITIREQGSPYLIVKESVELLKYQHKSELNAFDHFAVMIYSSSTPEPTLRANKSLEESYSKKDNMYYYHTDYFISISDIEHERQLLIKKYKNAYLFKNRERDFEYFYPYAIRMQ